MLRRLNTTSCHNVHWAYTSLKAKPVSGAADYFQAYLRQYMMAKKPVREDYQAWQNRQFVLDSIAWEQDPLIWLV